QLVREPAAHHLVQCARGELLLEVHRAVARELVHETGELGSYEHPQILVLGLRGHFARGHDPHHLLLPVDCFSWAASLRSCRSNSSRVRKWYASPSRSPGLALRVVADTEYPKISGSRVRSSRAMVVLPPPDGAASTTTRGVTPGCRAAPETSRARLSWR